MEDGTLIQGLTQTAFWVPLWDPRGPKFFLGKLGPRNEKSNVFFCPVWPEIGTFWPGNGKLKLIIGISNA